MACVKGGAALRHRGAMAGGAPWAARRAGGMRVGVGPLGGVIRVVARPGGDDLVADVRAGEEVSEQAGVEREGDGVRDCVAGH